MRWRLNLCLLLLGWSPCEVQGESPWTFGLRLGSLINVHGAGTKGQNGENEVESERMPRNVINAEGTECIDNEDIVKKKNPLKYCIVWVKELHVEWGCLRPREMRETITDLKSRVLVMRGGAGVTGRRQWDNTVEGLKNALASGLAAACVKTVLQPFDTVKTVQQFSTTRMSFFQAGQDIIVRGGVPELYQGLGVTLVGSIPAVGVYFGIYQFIKKQMDTRQEISPYVGITVSAGIGNFVASFFRVPYEVVKQRLQAGMYPTTIVALQSIYEQGGLLGFFGKSGLVTQWARDIPYAVVTLLVYESLQSAASKRRLEGAKASLWENMVIGAVAGGLGTLVTNPMDVVKTRMMTAPPDMYKGALDAAWVAFSKEGPQAFAKGATPRLLHKIPANAFFFVVYEFFRNVLGVTR